MTGVQVINASIGADARYLTARQYRSTEIWSRPIIHNIHSTRQQSTSELRSLSAVIRKIIWTVFCAVFCTAIYCAQSSVYAHTGLFIEVYGSGAGLRGAKGGGRRTPLIWVCWFRFRISFSFFCVFFYVQHRRSQFVRLCVLSVYFRD